MTLICSYSVFARNHLSYRYFVLLQKNSLCFPFPAVNYNYDLNLFIFCICPQSFVGLQILSAITFIIPCHMWPSLSPHLSLTLLSSMIVLPTLFPHYSWSQKLPAHKYLPFFNQKKMPSIILDSTYFNYLLRASIFSRISDDHKNCTKSSILPFFIKKMPPFFLGSTYFNDFLIFILIDRYPNYSFIHDVPLLIIISFTIWLTDCTKAKQALNTLEKLIPLTEWSY
jgi:hypothetical protein